MRALGAVCFALLTAAGCASAKSAGDDTHPDAASDIDAPASDIDAPPGRPDASDIDANGTIDANTTADANTTPDAPTTGCAHPTSGVLVTFDFTGTTGSQTSTQPKSTATGILGGPISRSAGLTAVAGAGSINSSGWPTTTTLDATKYYTFTITPDPTCVMDLTSMSIDTKASNTGPASAAVATSADNFAGDTTFTPSSVANVTLSVTGANAAIEVRVYGYHASSTSGTFRVQNTFTISGALR